MNVLLLSTHLNAGGITSYLLTLSKGLIGRGHVVHVATSGGNMEKAFTDAGVKCLTIHIRTKSELSPKIYLALRPLAQYIRANRIDVIHAQTRVTQVMGGWLSRMTKKPHVSTCHGFFSPRWSRKLFPCWGDAVIAISRPVAAHLSCDLGVDGRRVYLLPNGIDLGAFTPADAQTKSECRRRFDLKEGPVIGMIARLSEVKGQDVLIDAMAMIAQRRADVTLVLVGEGRTQNALREQVRRLNLDGRVRFFAIVNRTEEMLALFDIFVTPSRQEGLGLSILEAQAAGIPVVASRVGGIPEIIEDGRTGVLVEPEDPGALAVAIEDLLKDPQRSAAISTEARAMVRERFSSVIMCERVEQLYQKVMGRSS